MQTPGKSSGPSAPAKSLRRGVLNVDDGMRHVPSRRGRTLFAWLSGMRGHAVRRLRGTRTGALLRLRCRRPQRINAKMPTGQLPQDAGKTSSPRSSAITVRPASAFRCEGSFLFRPYLAAIRPIHRVLRQSQPGRRPPSAAKAVFFSLRILPRYVQSAALFGNHSPTGVRLPPRRQFSFPPISCRDAFAPPRSSASAARTASSFHHEGSLFRPYLAAMRSLHRVLRQAQPMQRPTSTAKAAFFSVRILPRCVRSAAHFGKRSSDCILLPPRR